MQVQQSPFGPVLGAVPRFRWPNPSADLLAAAAAANLAGEQPQQQQQGRPALAQMAAAAAGANPVNANSSLPNRATNLLAHPLLGGASQSGGLVFLPRLPWTLSDLTGQAPWWWSLITSCCMLPTSCNHSPGRRLFKPYDMVSNSNLKINHESCLLQNAKDTHRQ